MMAYPSRHGQSAGPRQVTDKHEHPEGHANEQDQSLEAQLDALLDDLEATEPEMVPKDLRKQQPESKAHQPVADKPAKPADPTPAPQPVASEVPKPQPVAQANLCEFAQLS